MENIIKELKKILPEENFKIQPKTSMDNLLRFEHLYGMTTESFIHLIQRIEHISIEDREEWISNYETYLAFSQ